MSSKLTQLMRAYTLPIVNLLRLFIAAITLVGSGQVAFATQMAQGSLARIQTIGLIAEVPFTNSHNWIVLDVKIGQDFVASDQAPTMHFLLDTGASASVLTREAMLANHLNLGDALSSQTAAHAEGAGDSSGINTNQSVRAAVQIGALRFVNSLAVFPLGESMRRLGIDGLIGDDVLRSFVTEVDYSARKVRFYDAAKYQPPSADARFETVPLDFRDSDGLPYVEAGITPFGFSSTSARMTIDTGDEGCVTLYTPYVQRQLWQDVLPQTVPANFSGIGGGGSAVAGRLRAANFGSTKLNLPPVIFAQSSQGALASDQSDGQFGGSLLSRFTVVLDFGRHTLYVRPNPQSTTPFPQMHYFGYFAAPPITADGGYRIGVVEHGSPADIAGLRVGDILYKINDMPLASLDADALSKAFQQGGEKSTIEIGNGSVSSRRQIVISGITY